ncbi:hypothetical protein RSAG8_08928, partial [Rhizoctonia solani AG-8 WAC10335]
MVAARVREARRQLMKSAALSTILNNLHTPPSYAGARPEAASKTLDNWAWNHTTKLARTELDKFAADAREEYDNVGDENENLTNFDNMNIEVLQHKAAKFTPHLMHFLTAVGETKNHARTRRKEDPGGALQPSFAAIMNVHSLAFQMSPRCNRLQKQLSLYFRSKHAPKSLFMLFNKCGFVASYIWSANAIKSLSTTQLEKLRDLVADHAIFWIYDNLRLPVPIKAQRGDRHTVTDNGTAMTVVKIPDSVKHIFMKEIPEKFGPPPQTTSWETHAEISPAIPVLGELAGKVEDNLINFKRTRVHKGINAELDISRLASRHLTHKLHQLVPDQKLEDAKDKSKDYVDIGEQSLIHTKWLENLHKSHQDYQSIRSTEQTYSQTENTEEEMILEAEAGPSE